jgi:hypothetical protein
MVDRYPAGGCVLRDKATCKLPHATCCDEGRAARWYCPDHPGPLDDATGHVCRLHPTARLAAETADPDGGDGRGLCPDRLPSTP